MTRPTLKHTTGPRARLFFAACPDDAVRERLAQVQAAVESQVDAQATQAARTTQGAVAPDNFHLTLAFLGEVASDVRDCCAQAANTVEIPLFNVTLDRLGYFERRDLCWFGPSVMPMALRTLHKRLQRALAPCGYHDRREFKPHVTLFRKAARLKAPDEVAPVEWRVDRFFLMESVQRDGGVIYIPLEEYL